MRVLLTLAIVAFAAPDRPDPTPKQAVAPSEQILGDWEIVSGPKDGVLRVRRITAANMLILVNGTPWPNDQLSGDYKVDWSKSPATFEIPRTRCKGILKIEGDLLTICYTFGGPYPAEFKTVNGNRVTLSQRMKK